jgi:hypothetical protein
MARDGHRTVLIHHEDSRRAQEGRLAAVSASRLQQTDEGMTNAHQRAIQRAKDKRAALAALLAARHALEKDELTDKQQERLDRALWKVVKRT